MDDDQRKTLQWLADQHFEEQRALRTAEENLFNWSTSIFLASLGALTSLKATGAQWSGNWLFLLTVGIVVVILVILLLAYLIRRNYVRNQEALSQIMTSLSRGNVPMDIPGQVESVTNSALFFYLRWAAVAAIGIVAVGLISLLG